MKSETNASASCSDTTDTTGESNLLLQTWDPQFKAKHPLQISCKANVQDINRQTQGTECKTIVHSCQYYVGVRCTKKVVLKPDDPIDCFFIVTDVQGNAVTGVPIQCKLVKLGSETKGYNSWETITPITELAIVSQSQPVLHTFTLSKNTNDSAYGEYAIMCEIKESTTPLFRSGINRCSVEIRKFGHKSHLQSKGYASLNQESLELVANKYDSETYKPGEVASIFVSPPFSGNCAGIMWVTCNGLVQKEEFEISGEAGFIELKVPIKKEYRPNIDIHVKLYGLDKYIDEKDKERQLPAHASGLLKLNVSKEHHELDVVVIPKHSVTSPGKETSVEVVVTDKEGRNQQNCEVCLIVADEAVLDMVSHEIQDPVSTFVIQNTCQTSFISNRSDVRYWLYPRKNQREIELNEETQEASRNCYAEDEDEECEEGALYDDMKCCECVRCTACLSKSCAKEECRKCSAKKDCAPSCSAGHKCKKSSAKRSRAPPKPNASCCAGEYEEMEERKDQFAVRSNFRPDAAFIAFANTDENGRVILSFKLTDSLTRFRVTAVANMGDDLFGIGKTKITTSLPMAVRPSLPRFLNYGDMCDLTYVLQNQTTAALTVAVVCHTSNLRIFNNEDQNQRDKGVNLVIPALGRTEVRFPVRVLKCGTAMINVGLRVLNAVADKAENQDQADLMIGWSDAVKNEFRIFTPATNEAFATYGDMSETNETILQPIALPDKPLLANFGEFTLTTSTTALSSLVDSLIYLYSYPYECNEQRASKLLGIVCMKEIILQFYSPEELFNLMKIRSREEVDEFVNKELKMLFDNQRYDGSYSYWTAKLFGDPYLTCYVALCFAKCKQEGYQIPEATLRKTKSILQRIDSLFFLSFLWPRVVKDSIKSFAYYVFSLLAEPYEYETVISLCESVLSHYKDVTDFTNQLTPECAAWLAMAIHKCKKEESEEEPKKSSKKTATQWLDLFRKYFTENVTLDSGVYAHFITRYEDSEIANMVMLHSNTRTDSLVLSCLMEIDREKSSDIIQKLVRSLLAARNNSRYGRWYNTQENATCLIALTDYFKIFENEVPDLTLHSWLIDRTRSEETLYIGEESWKGRSREKKITSLPIKAFAPRKDIEAEVINPKELDTKKELLVTKSGPGRLYYRIALSYTPENLCLKSMDRGFSVYRYYEGVTNAEHVKFDKAENVWKIKAGELVRVQLTITNTVKRYNVALVDKIPAGFEVVNPEIDTQIVDLNQKVDESTYGFSQSWHEHQNIRDERVEAFARMLHVGCHSFTYVARATTIGSFVAPPSHMEEMYSPECFGRSKTEFVQVYDGILH
ncbi:hypothetical protein C9374_007059 [Naegleria lovaniensis]|uniref:TNFR-Cys domain-containing protein n=1 Tax=Naegleria lovaniensis TaxID=51637 RepID=A0AA88GYT1_NAELO|nr:uncharacterized protein C9374_007059 [Naegleria lovaniensis]KAG2393528.1 hypothetical protein C9374_007059 [Naegleria lovaniensis]